MNLLNTILVGLKEVWSHKFRSLLTMLGIILGVASLVGMAAIIKGMENGMRETMIAMGGADKVLLEEEDVPPEQEHLADQAPGRTMADVTALRECAPLLRLISPEMAIEDVTVSRADKMAVPSEAVGVWPAVVDMNMHTVEYGRFFHRFGRRQRQSGMRHRHRNPRRIVRGPGEDRPGDYSAGRGDQHQRPALYYCGHVYPLRERTGKKQRQAAKQQPQQAQAGPARRKGWGHGNWAFYRKNRTLYMPLNTAWMRFRAASADTNGAPDNRLSDIDLKIIDLEHLEPALQQARNVLMMTHHGIEDFGFRTQENQLESINQQIHNARMSGGIIAGH